MTNLDWLNDLIPEVRAAQKKAILNKWGLDEGQDYSGGEAIELAEADLYIRLLMTPDFSEGQLSIKYNRDAIKNAANIIYKKYGYPLHDNGGDAVIRRVKL